jgi:hypothetical protein
MFPEWLNRCGNEVDNVKGIFWKEMFLQLALIEIKNKQANSTG